ncbi:MAG: cell division protein FtsA [Candidatus Moranbacteria bacterium RIFCSPHIGHO2_01_FULL_55_24]|nr:MAG: cell division protein FtsA [Candidatus Moranbacteria bacterium RIFCSPHIGHO2_01_FULL_55_24]
MSKGHYYVGLDIGSSAIRAVIAQELSQEEALRIIGVGTAPAFGMRRGAVTDAEAVAKAANAALEQAERMAGHAAEEVVVSVSGAELECLNALGVVAVGRADGEVTEDDTARALAEVQARLTMPLNREIIHVIPRDYRLDDQKNIKDPLGMRGVRLEMNALVVSGSASHLKNIHRSLDAAGTSATRMVAEPLASAEAVLSAKQKELGTVLINIGGSTTSLAVFEDGDLLHLAVLPVGSSHITNDVAIGLRTSIEVAEAVKLQYGSAQADGISKREEIDLNLFDSEEDGLVSRYHVAEIIEARLEEILGLVNAELKNIGREGLLPGGAVLTGGGSLLPGVVDFAKEILRLPVHIGYPKPLGGILDEVDSPQFATAVGLVLYAQESGPRERGFSPSRMFGAMPESMQGMVGKIRHWSERFLP